MTRKGWEGEEVRSEWHFRVNKQSCKQGNLLILWVVEEHHKKKIDFLLFFLQRT
jgi:hypothetical protein